MKKQILIVLLLLACVNVGVFLGFFFITDKGRITTISTPSRQVACGPLCLHIAANLYGIPCDESHALSACPPDADGTRLSDIQRAAARLGMKASVAKLSWQKLLDIQELAILHVNDNHYVLANPQEQTGVEIRIYDPDIGARWYDRESLEAIWKGTSLVLVKDLGYQFPSLISTSAFWIDKGDLTAEDTAEYFFTVKNVSPKPIELKIGPTSCQCSSAFVTHKKLESGKETALIATIDLSNKRGVFRERVILLSTCGDEKRMDSFILAGTVIRHDILSAKRLFVGSTYRGGTLKETFAINDPGNGQLKNVEATLRESVSWINAKFTCEKVTATNQQVARKLNAKLGDWIIVLTGEVKKDAPLQNFKFPIAIQTNLATPLDAMDVSLEGEIVPAVDVEPAALIFTDLSIGRPKTLHIKSPVSSLRLPEPRIRIEDNVPLHYTIERINDQEYSIVIQMDTNDNSKSNSFAADIELDFGEEGTISIPVIYQANTDAK